MVKISCKNSAERCRSWIQEDPTKLIRYIVLLICVIVVVVQLSECFLKLRYPPISTHSHYDLNETMSLPAVTFCREPPYKPEVLKKYNLQDHPKYELPWDEFPFSTANVSQVFIESTYPKDEILIQYGLSGKPELVDIQSTLHFTLGLCHTFRAVQPSKSSFKGHGYSIMLKHDMTQIESDLFKVPAGWHIYIHEAKENFTEIRMKSSGRVEYMFAEVEEDIEIKLQSQFFNMMADGQKLCANNQGYSSTKCGELCIWRDLTKRYGCGGPWMPDISVPTCDNNVTMKGLITDYSNIYDDNVEPTCNCPEPCQSTIYSAFVMNRKYWAQPRPSTQVYIYYTSKLVTIIEERPGYDLSQFVADMGGSIGFLLGLSVLGFIEILENIASLILLSIVKKKKKDLNELNSPERRNSFTDGGSDVTMEIATISDCTPNAKGK